MYKSTKQEDLFVTDQSKCEYFVFLDTMMETDLVSETFCLKEHKKMENIQDSSYVHCKTSWIGIFNINSEH
jgi:hypothetical protein